MKQFLIAASVLAASQVAMATPSQAATCADRTHVVTQLETRYGETLHAVSAARTGRVLEVYSSPNTESWTLLLSLGRDDLSCLVASGRGSESLNTRYGSLFKNAKPVKAEAPVKTTELAKSTKSQPSVER